ncbi:hypothetical protein PAT3040_05253 [Paenibacillus agaridevorans]|uniref:Uncharacterized protein n=2 Tax=Paenibacillus agaridevorans TaxID=171404 RepID=A0A2R5EUY9_9BACL|nr:hypothetical protein PAT3040_05253 [Paenibacillus agaridevorans]
MNGATSASETGNRKRNRVHRLEQPVAAEQMRVVVEATAGSKHAQIIEIRVYKWEERSRA